MLSFATPVLRKTHVLNSLETIQNSTDREAIPTSVSQGAYQNCVTQKLMEVFDQRK